MAAKPPRISRRLVEDSMNRAIILVVNELRLQALRRRSPETTEIDVPIERLFTEAKRFIAGQFGHDPVTKELSPVAVSRKRLQAALRALAPAWKGAVEGERVSFAIEPPKRRRSR